MITPRVVPIVSITGLAGLLLCGLLTWWIVQDNKAEERRDCARAVAARDDQRSMWLYVIDTATPSKDPEQQKRIAAFVTELDMRLPALQCEGGNWVPKEQRD